MVRKIFTYKSCALLSATFILWSQTCAGQFPAVDFDSRYDLDNEMFRKPHWEFVFAPNITAAAHITHLPDAKYILKSLPQSSYEFGIQRVTQLMENLGFGIGLRFAVVGRSEEFIVPYREIGYDKEGNYDNTGPFARQKDITYFSIPALLEYRSFSSAKVLFTATVGLSLRFAPLNGVLSGVMSPTMDVMEVSFDVIKNLL